MQRLLALTALTTLLFSVPVAAEDEIIHQARWRTVDFNRAFVEDLVNPEGKTRWELGGIVLTDSWIRTIREVDGGGLSISDSRRAGSEPLPLKWRYHAFNGTAKRSPVGSRLPGFPSRSCGCWPMIA